MEARYSRAPGMAHALKEEENVRKEVRTRMPTVVGRKGNANRARACPEMGCLKEA